jgi:hypothetical protein
MGTSSPAGLIPPFPGPFLLLPPHHDVLAYADIKQMKQGKCHPRMNPEREGARFQPDSMSKRWGS